MEDITLLRSKTGEFFGDFNDINYTAGDIQLLENESRIRQAIVKILLTRQGSNQVFTGYGTELQDLLKRSALDLTIQADISNTIAYGLSYLTQAETSTDPSEVIEELEALEIIYDENQKTSFVIKLVLRLVNGKKITITLGS